MTLLGGRGGTAASKLGNVRISLRRKSSNSEYRLRIFMWLPCRAPKEGEKKRSHVSALTFVPRLDSCFSPPPIAGQTWAKKKKGGGFRMERRALQTNIHGFHADVENYESANVGRAPVDNDVIRNLHASRPTGAIAPSPVLRLVIPHGDAAALQESLRVDRRRHVALRMMDEPIRWRCRRAWGRYRRCCRLTRLRLCTLAVFAVRSGVPICAGSASHRRRILGRGVCAPR